MKKFKINISLLVMIVMSSSVSLSAKADDWWKSLEDRNGFSEFAPPAIYSNKEEEKKRFQWRSGSSMKSFNNEKYATPRVSKNPWKPVKSFNYKRTFTSNRPWGKLPERKPKSVNNMRFHDERFKQWVNRVDSSHQNNYLHNVSGLAPGLSQAMSPYYIDPLMNRGSYSRGVIPGGFVPFTTNSPGLYGMYPVSRFPYGGFPGQLVRW